MADYDHGEEPDVTAGFLANAMTEIGPVTPKRRRLDENRIFRQNLLLEGLMRMDNYGAARYRVFNIRKVVDSPPRSPSRHVPMVGLPDFSPGKSEESLPTRRSPYRGSVSPTASMGSRLATDGPRRDVSSLVSMIKRLGERAGANSEHRPAHDSSSRPRKFPRIERDSPELEPAFKTPLHNLDHLPMSEVESLHSTPEQSPVVPDTSLDLHPELNSESAGKPDNDPGFMDVHSSPPESGQGSGQWTREHWMQLAGLTHKIPELQEKDMAKVYSYIYTQLPESVFAGFDPLMWDDIRDRLYTMVRWQRSKPS